MSKDGKPCVWGRCNGTQDQCHVLVKATNKG